MTSGLEVSAAKIATSMAAAAGRYAAQRRQRGREQRDVTRAVAHALVTAFDAAKREGLTADRQWMAAAAAPLVDSFTPEVTRALLLALGDAGNDGEDAFVGLARAAVGVERAELLEATVSVDEFLHQFPRRLFGELRALAIKPDGHARRLVGHLLQQRADARGDILQRATPWEFRDDVAALLSALQGQARTGGLPSYMPSGAEAVTLARSVRAFGEVSEMAWEEEPDEWAEGLADQSASRVYRLPADRGESVGPRRRWPDVVAGYARLVVLADPGLGKSWLIRSETQRRCREALGALAAGEDVNALVIPVPLRCDQVVAAGAESLAEAAADHLVAQGVLRRRSRAGVQAMIEAGAAVLLLDALDELATPQERGRFKELLRSWTGHVGDAARCVVTSRIAGYTGPPMPQACEVELQALTPEDVTAAIAAWSLPPSARNRLLNRLKDPAAAGMARVPLLLAFMCSLAATTSTGDELPRTRGELYERALRWFLTRAHRAEEDPKRPELLETEVDALLDILAPVAFHFATMPGGWTDLMPSAEVLAAIRGAGPAFIERAQPAAEVLRELSIGAGVLVPEGNPSAGRSPRYLFLHRTITEYLVARHLAGQPAVDWLKVVDQHMWFDPDWAEVIPLLGAQLDRRGARRLVEHLLAQNIDPFHHALLVAVRVLAERPDRDHLLAIDQMHAAADAIAGLMDHPATRRTAASQLAAAPMLPCYMLDRLRDRLDDTDPLVRWAAVKVLTSREEPALLARLQDEDAGVRRAAVKAVYVGEGHSIVVALVALLNDRDPQVQLAAVEALGSRQEPEAVDCLLASLDSDKDFLRTAAGKALARCAGPEVLDGLLERLGDPDWLVNEAACEALSRRSDPALLDELLTRVDYGDPPKREAAARVLATWDRREVLDALLERINSDDPAVRRIAVRGLADWTGPDVVEALLARLSDPEGDIRRAAWQSLSGLAEPGLLGELLTRLRSGDTPEREAAAKALAAWDGPEVVEGLLACLDSDNTVVRRAAVHALARWAAPGQDMWPITDSETLDLRWAFVEASAARAGSRALAGLLATLDSEDRDPLVRCAAVRVLASQDGSDVLERLIARLHDEDMAVRDTAARTLARQQARGVVDALLPHLGDHDWEVRYVVVRALAGQRGPTALESLRTRLDDEEPLVRWAAVQALGEQASPGAVEALLGCLVAEDVWHVRSPAVRVLAEREEPILMEVLLGCLDADEPTVREAAFHALAKREGQGVLEGLLGRLTDPVARIRREAIYALWTRDGPGVLERLVDRLGDEDFQVSFAAMVALGNRERPDDLSDLAGLARTGRPEILLRLYEAAELLTTRAYSRLAPESQARVRADLAWLTSAVLQTQSDRPYPASEIA